MPPRNRVITFHRREGATGPAIGVLWQYDDGAGESQSMDLTGATDPFFRATRTGDPNLDTVMEGEAIIEATDPGEMSFTPVTNQWSLPGTYWCQFEVDHPLYGHIITPDKPGRLVLVIHPSEGNV